MMKYLGDAELKIMLALWGAKAPVTAGCILERLKGKRNRTLFALMTAPARLAAKGFVVCHRFTRSNDHAPLIEEKEYKSFENGGFLNKCHKASLSHPAAGLYDCHAGRTARPARQLRGER